MSQNRSAAVMEQRAPSVVVMDTPLEALFRKLNYFPTPPWAARAIAHRLKQMDPAARTVCDPACGEGHFAEPLREVFGAEHSYASDIYNYGYGMVADFLAGPPLGQDDPVIDWYVTNPPFELAQQFVEQALRLARRGVIVLCRVAFLESIDRYPLLYGAPHPLTCLMPFAERVPMQLGSWDPDLHSATAYAAFMFHKHAAPMPPIGFAPGTRAKFSRLTDAARFVVPAPIPLFANMAPTPLFREQCHV